jgi:hypothetical protein
MVHGQEYTGKNILKNVFRLKISIFECFTKLKKYLKKSTKKKRLKDIFSISDILWFGGKKKK